jgi:hypothetical protein
MVPSKSLSMLQKDMNVCRPDGYNTSEKLLSWSRLGWGHFGIYSFVAFCIAGIGSINEATVKNFNIVILRVLDIYDLEEARPLQNWTREYNTFLIFPVMIAFAFLVGSRFGRFIPLIGAILCTIAISPLLWEVSSPKLYVLGSSLTQFLLLPIVSVLVYMYCYETTPMRYRAPIMIGMAIFETLGAFVVGLVNEMIPAEMPETDDEVADGEDRYINLWRTIQISSYAPALLALVIGLAFVHRDTPLCLVVRGYASSVYDYLFEHGSNNSSEPVPVSREDFLINTDIEKHDSITLGENLRIAMGPMCVVFIASIAYTSADRIFVDSYYYAAEQIMGEGYLHHFLPGMIMNHFVSMAGLFLAVLGWWKWKDIRFVPAVAGLCIAIGALICSTVEVVEMNSNGYPLMTEDISSPNTVVVGIIPVLFGMAILKASIRIVALDLFTIGNRFQGMFVLKAFEILAYAVNGVWCTFAINYEWCFIISAGVVAVISGSIFAAFYLTKWFDHSIICRDPETDACWLVQEKYVEQSLFSRGGSTNPGNSSDSYRRNTVVVSA